jgi:hypothetical protein
VVYDILTVLAYLGSRNIPFEMIVKIAHTQIDQDIWKSKDRENIGRGGSTSSPQTGTSDNEDDEYQASIMEVVARLEELYFLIFRVVEGGSRGSTNRLYDIYTLV